MDNATEFLVAKSASYFVLGESEFDDNGGGGVSGVGAADGVASMEEDGVEKHERENNAKEGQQQQQQQQPQQPGQQGQGKQPAKTAPPGPPKALSVR